MNYVLHTKTWASKLPRHGTSEAYNQVYKPLDKCFKRPFEAFIGVLFNTLIMICYLELFSLMQFRWVRTNQKNTSFWGVCYCYLFGHELLIIIVRYAPILNKHSWNLQYTQHLFEVRLLTFVINQTAPRQHLLWNIMGKGAGSCEAPSIRFSHSSSVFSSRWSWKHDCASEKGPHCAQAQC